MAPDDMPTENGAPIILKYREVGNIYTYIYRLAVAIEIPNVQFQDQYALTILIATWW